MSPSSFIRQAGLAVGILAGSMLPAAAAHHPLSHAPRSASATGAPAQVHNDGHAGPLMTPDDRVSAAGAEFERQTTRKETCSYHPNWAICM
jgi:hypothetical protein